MSNGDVLLKDVDISPKNYHLFREDSNFPPPIIAVSDEWWSTGATVDVGSITREVF
jgi:hypothetical protein